MRFDFPITSFVPVLVETSARVDLIETMAEQRLVAEIKPGAALTPDQRRCLRFLRLTRKDIEEMRKL